MTAMATAMENARVPCYGGGGSNVGGGGGGGERKHRRKQPPWCGEFLKVECRAIFER